LVQFVSPEQIDDGRERREEKREGRRKGGREGGREKTKMH
jgi:hypothetical protein